MDNPKYQRQNLRLKHYNYTQAGLYFVTICCQNRFKYFGEIMGGRFIGNASADMVEDVWTELSSRFSMVLHEYTIMPNHFHAILEIKDDSSHSLGDMIGAFKSLTTNQYIEGVRHKDWLPFGKRLWQRNYYEHVIRHEKSYLQLSEYIQNNPWKWEEDMFFM